jgi:uncharacterized protein YjbI with pentapeptide repeats
MVKDQIAASARGVLLILLILGIPAALYRPGINEVVCLVRIACVIFCIVGITALVLSKQKLNMAGALVIILLLSLTWLVLVVVSRPTDRLTTTIKHQLGQRDFRDVDLSNAHLRGANLTGTDLSGAELRGAELRGANLSDTHLRWANLSGANLYDADLRRADLRDADLRGANLNRANLDDDTQIDAKWRLVWEIVNQGGADRDLSGVNLSDAHLFEVYLHRADLSMANLEGADLRLADLSEACLHQADLSGANLRGADLRWTDLSGAYLTGAIVTDARLAKAKSLEGATMPDGAVHE